MKKLIIAIDCDDVIVPTAPMIIEHYNKTYGTTIELKDFYSNDLRVWDTKDNTAAKDRVDLYLESDEYQNTKPFVEAIEAIRKLGEHHELHLVTGRADFLSVATEKMLSEHFPGLFASLEFTNFFGKNPRSKADVCAQLHADYLIEDHLHHAKVVAECGTKVLLFGEYPWNQTDEPLHPNIQRAHDWAEVVRVLVKDNISHGAI
jgi:5'(3')-deoxyribonucleotidase